MDSIEKLIRDCNKLLSSEVFDKDVNVNMTINNINYWCYDFLRIHANIRQTSLSPSHEIERKQKLINDLLNL